MVTRPMALLKSLPIISIPNSWASSSPSKPFDRFTNMILPVSRASLKLMELFGWPMMGRITAFVTNWFSLLVMYGAILLSEASPSAASACFLQKLTTSGFVHVLRRNLRKLFSSNILGTSIKVAVQDSFSNSRSRAFLMYCSKIGPPVCLRS